MSEILNSKDKDEHVIFCMLYQLYVELYMYISIILYAKFAVHIY